MGQHNQAMTQKQALTNTRIVWAAMVLSLLALGAIGVYLIWQGIQGGNANQPAGGGTVMSVIALIALLGGTFAGYLLRQQAFKAGWTGNAVKPDAFVKGSILLFAPVEVAATVAVIFAIVEGSIFPTMLLAALGLVVLLINFPTGSAMDETLPDLTAR
ncbi:MAG: hypothetical protein ACOC1G_03555 [Phycisphaeraceae bacterium]